MKAWEAAIEVLRETNNPAVMWGDCGLLHAIARKANMRCQGKAWKTEERVLNALSRAPGKLRKGFTVGERGRRVLIFRAPEAS